MTDPVMDMPRFDPSLALDDSFGPPRSVRLLLRRPILRRCPRSGAWRHEGEFTGRGAVVFGDPETAGRFARCGAPRGRLDRVTVDGPFVFLDGPGSDEQLGMRLHVAAVAWLQAEGEPVVVDRVHVVTRGGGG
ncbi:hypothetical protein [Sorangium sp. So ce1024]|uniref:hypothetical protein n=1 Tax=Sorangium sp. So ce1024 TaxID=3133327 RepID=UPI003F0F6146